MYFKQHRELLLQQNTSFTAGTLHICAPGNQAVKSVTEPLRQSQTGSKQGAKKTHSLLHAPTCKALVLICLKLAWGKGKNYLPDSQISDLLVFIFDRLFCFCVESWISHRLRNCCSNHRESRVIWTNTCMYCEAGSLVVISKYRAHKVHTKAIKKKNREFQRAGGFA